MNDDLNDARTRERQHNMKLALARTGLGQHILGELPEPRLSAPTCQWGARDLRQQTEKRALKMLSVCERNQLLFVTWVPPHEFCIDRPFCHGAGPLLQSFKEGCRSVGICAIAAAAEADFDVTDGGWQSTVHAVVAAPQSHCPGSVSDKLNKLLNGQSPVNRARVYRPMQVKVVSDLEGALAYTFKSLAVLSTTQRSTWTDTEGRRRSAKQRLRTPQLKQLLLQTISDGLQDRILLAQLNEVQS